MPVCRVCCTEMSYVLMVNDIYKTVEEEGFVCMCPPMVINDLLSGMVFQYMIEMSFEQYPLAMAEPIEIL